MGQPKGGALLRVALVLALVAGLALLTRGVRAEGDRDDDGGDEPAVVIHGGNNSVVNNVTFDADGGEGLSDSAGGDINTGGTVGGQAVDASGGTTTEGDVASGGNGGVSASDASGGTLYSPTRRRRQSHPGRRDRRQLRQPDQRRRHRRRRRQHVCRDLRRRHVDPDRLHG